MTERVPLRIWTMQLGDLSEQDVGPWLVLLDATERARAARFVFSRHRTTFIAAHALTRWVLSRLHGGATPEQDWHFVPGERGKPVAWIGNDRACLSFNLSHTDGLVGLATIDAPGKDIGFDVEALDRTVTLEVADRYFRPEEVSWLHALPAEARPGGFLRLWTLKEAFIKATGEGLGRDLASFWFALPPPVVHFADGSDRPEDWHFEQRTIGQRHIAAVGIQCPGGTAPAMEWVDVAPATIVV